MTIRNVLPDWYPAPRHLNPMPLTEWVVVITEQRKKYKKMGLLEEIDDKFNFAKGRWRYGQWMPNWRKYKLLDYLELTHWALTNGVWNDKYFLAETLFPDEYEIDIRSRLSSVVKPQSFSLVSKNSVAYLEELVSMKKVGNFLV